jgi:FtsP/CotA-like multicopper oxidase with cupredoxin domain
VLSDTRIELAIGESLANFTGRTRPAITVNGSLPAPILRWREGQTVDLFVRNTLERHPTSIHWHGILLPANMDGVPGLSFNGIGPGETYHYHFQLKQSGTYWYHSHSMFQEQAGLYGALIIDPAEPAPYRHDREHVIMLSDWTDMDPGAVPAHEEARRARQLLQAHGARLPARREARRLVGRAVRPWHVGPDADDADRHLRHQRAHLHLPDERHRPGRQLDRAVPQRREGAAALHQWRLDDLLRRAHPRPEDDRGRRRWPVHPSGQHRRVPHRPAETYDVLVEPTGQDAFTIFCQDMGRTGYAAGTLAVRHGLQAPIPARDPRPLLTMSDMGHDMGGGGHGGHDMAAMKGMEGGCGASMGHGAHGGGDAASKAPKHPASERNNPLVDMQSSATEPKLDDPGIGLRDNGRQVLTYGAMRSLFEDPDGREPSREIELHLTGHMEKFSWSFDGIPFASAEPLRLNYGERMRIVLVNDTMMQHPIHLHGVWSDLENAQGEFQVRKHTIDMPPGTRRSYRVRADALGRWAYHCHLLYHMEAGMMREVRIEE